MRRNFPKALEAFREGSRQGVLAKSRNHVIRRLDRFLNPYYDCASRTQASPYALICFFAWETGFLKSAGLSDPVKSTAGLTSSNKILALVSWEKSVPLGYGQKVRPRWCSMPSWS